jgi:hypothetical protein
LYNEIAETAKRVSTAASRSLAVPQRALRIERRQEIVETRCDSASPPARDSAATAAA